MKPTEFQINVEVEKHTGDILAVYFHIRNGRAAKVKEFADGNAFANYSSKGDLLGIELLGPCDVTVLDRIASKEPKVRDFVKRSIPREMALVA